MAPPSQRSMVRLVDAKHQNISMLTSIIPQSTGDTPPMGIGDKVAQNPKTRKMLKTLLPMMLPMAMDELPFRAATMDVASSGSEVATAITVKPKRVSSTARPMDISLAEFTDKTPPPHKHAAPKTMQLAVFHPAAVEFRPARLPGF